MQATRITKVEDLKRLASKYGGHDFFLALQAGLRSSKHISYDDGIFYVFHEIDGTEEEIKEEALMESRIGENIKDGNFYKYAF